LVDVSEFATARTLLDALLDEDVEANIRGRALLVRADSEIADRSVLVRYLNESLALSKDSLLRRETLMRLAQHGHWIFGDAEGATSIARSALEIAEGVGDPALLAESDAA